MPALKVLFFLAGTRNKASSRVRGFWMAEELTRLGAKCAVVAGRSKRVYLECLSRLLGYDIVFFQKRFSLWDHRFMKAATILGKRTIFDLDDASFLRADGIDSRRNISYMMKSASAVVAGSRNLLEYARRIQVNSYLVPSSINLEHYEPSRRQGSRSKVCLGWIGHGAEYRRDLIEILREPLIEVAARCSVRLKLVGVCRQKELYEAFSSIPNLETTFLDSIDWFDPLEVRRTMEDFDIGLYPVLANEFNDYKCGFKALEYGAMEIPVVASPVGANRDVVSAGRDGYLPRRKEEWIQALTSLIDDRDARRRMGQAGRLKVERDFNLSAVAKALAKVMVSTKN